MSNSTDQELERTRDRVTQLEQRFTYFERLVEELNQVVIEQSQELAAHKAQLKALEQDRSEEFAPHDVKPPHF